MATNDRPLTARGERHPKRFLDPTGKDPSAALSSPLRRPHDRLASENTIHWQIVYDRHFCARMRYRPMPAPSSARTKAVQTRMPFLWAGKHLRYEGSWCMNSRLHKVPSPFAEYSGSGVDGASGLPLPIQLQELQRR